MPSTNFNALAMVAKHIYFVGTAGCGKSTLTNAFRLWLQNQGYDGITVNLDPGASTLLYAPDVDVRDWIRIEDVMADQGLGPNGAQVAAADMLALRVREIAQVIDGYDTDFVLIDTPGQVELFTFRQSSRVVVEELSGEAASLCYLFDPLLAKTANGYVSTVLLASTVHFRMPFPMILLLSKADLLSETDVERILLWGQDYYALFNALLDDSTEAQTQVSIEFLQALESVEPGRSVIPVSSETAAGMEDIYATMQQIFEGGEDIEH